MSQKRRTPPRWLDWLLELYCRGELLEDLQGDLHEYYSRNLRRSRFRADLIFFLDVIKFFRPYTIRKPQIIQKMNYFSLFQNYLKTSFRSIVRNRLFSSINIIGLSVAMAIGILMITYVSQLVNYDNFHEKKDRIYKLYSAYDENSDGFSVASTSVYMADKLAEDYAGIEDILILKGLSSQDFTYAEKTLPLEGLFASSSFFNVLSFELLRGNSEEALKEPYTIVLTESAEQKFFPDEDGLGKVLTVGEKEFTITGILKDPPANTHLGEFEVLESFATHRAYMQDHDYNFVWRGIWNDHVYVLLEEEAKPATIQGHLDNISKEENEKRESYAINFYLKNVTSIVPGAGESNNISSIYINWEDINKLIILGIVILLSSCFNYTNLSIARSLRRAREVGVRKVVGATHGQVFLQFILEAILISCIAFVFAFGIYFLIKPFFEKEVIDSEQLQLVIDSSYLVYFFFFVVLVGVFAGFLPAFILSKLKAISILKDVTKLAIFKGMTLRKVLLVLQFSVSMALIIAATISYRQYMFSINYDMGFRSENIVNIDLWKTGVDPEMLKTELEKIPEVDGVGTSLMLPGTRSMYSLDITFGENDSLSIFYNKIDADYLKIHDIQYLAGGPFGENRKDSVGYIIIDEEVRKLLGYQNAQEAIGELVTSKDDGWSLQITGVLKDYEYTDLQNGKEPTALIQNYKNQIYHVNVRVNSTDMIGTMGRLEQAWREVDEVHNFQAEFYDQQIQSSYAEYKTMFRLFTFLAVIAILISTMGLLGIAVFTTESRIKEISVRKVLGATESNLILLLSRNFLVLLGISALIAIPFVYYLFDQHILIDFRERISIGLLELLPGVFIILFVAILTIVWQTLKAAKTNPATMLRSE